MPVPKQRHNPSRRGRRRNHITRTLPALQKCADCGEMTRPHTVCIHCGMYRGIQHKEVVQKA